ncbi:AbrB/MazE/SpoVT family DNA-binding domain-containing protein [Geminocystis sp. GBBB08]|uniref:AbrB/MazE/SpoVT family DNA-binding domain-containing protein n=1 Tax=Geminocystis sp. GBBB08 TaxID=2604140 RepID=UPI0027E332B9|nr:AbrB/MazE/SpoVT family DNA-binding domain-containing protein [Geminocystis sp. GBBB08]MBL1210589.1 AbrB/MazE/SpoVT family DNA-binding domain-containing protein [Geminocystis sp. GBBB08]
MLSKLTAKNQLTLPKKIIKEIGECEYFDIKLEHGQIILTPVKIQRADAVRMKLLALDLTEEDIASAVAWSRES